MSDENDVSGPLTEDEWNALLFSASAANRPFIYRLAIHHGVILPPPTGRCPCCGNDPHAAPRQERLIP